jgi:acetyl-CoA acetyltransferase
VRPAVLALLVVGRFSRDRVNPNGGSLALGHPFAATGARILSQAVKELAAIRTCEPFMHRTDGNAGIRALAPAWISSLDLEAALG